MSRIAVLVSGSGSNLQALIDADLDIDMVISDKEDAYALKRAEVKGIKTYYVKRGPSLSDEIYKLIKDKVDLIVLAGFLSILNGDIMEEFRNRIINIHPSLIPSFCGKGMYGIKVHEKALEFGVKYSGCTVHFVDEGTDTGPILLQKVVEVLQTDTPKVLQERILVKEHEAIVEAVRLVCEGRIHLNGRLVTII